MSFIARNSVSGLRTRYDKDRPARVQNMVIVKFGKCFAELTIPIANCG